MNISAVVVHYDMRRELPRTLETIRRQDPYEVVTFGSLSTSPCQAMNVGVRASSGDIVICCIDGARMLSPGILRKVKQAFQLFDDPFVYVLGMHIGHEKQGILAQGGWNQKDEDKLLSKVDWRKDGYELFRISCIAGSSTEGFWGGATEANCFAVRRDTYFRLGGYDERFVLPGGGYCNLELFSRFQRELQPVQLLGEATFHQFHGGVSSNALPEDSPKTDYEAEYERLFGRKFASHFIRPYYLGDIPRQAEWVFCPQLL